LQFSDDTVADVAIQTTPHPDLTVANFDVVDCRAHSSGTGTLEEYDLSAPECLYP